MTEEKILYTKQGRDLSYFLNLSRNPQMLLRYSKHFVFTIATSEDLFLVNRCNDPKFLFPDFRNKINQIVEKYIEMFPKHSPYFFETLRSNVRQKDLYNSGHTKITKYSMHYFGIAVDIINNVNNQKQWNLNYNKLITLGYEVGLYNLIPYEMCHFQFIPVNKQDDWREFTVNLIRVIQDLLNCKVDGILGKITQGAILLNLERLEKYFISLEPKLKY